MQLRKRGDKWYLRGTVGGERIEKCSGLTDKKAAERAATVDARLVLLEQRVGLLEHEK